MTFQQRGKRNGKSNKEVTVRIRDILQSKHFSYYTEKMKNKTCGFSWMLYLCDAISSLDAKSVNLSYVFTLSYTCTV